MKTWGEVEELYREAEQLAKKHGVKVVSDVTPGESDWVNLLDFARVVKELENEGVSDE